MTPFIYGQIFLMLFLLGWSAFFSGSETALFSLTRAQIQQLKSSSKAYAKKIISVLLRPRETLIALLLWNEMVNGAFAILIAGMVHEIFGAVDWKVSTLFSVLITTPLVLIFGEMIPKNIAIRHAMTLVPFLVFPVRFFSRIVFPLRYLLTKFADRMVLLFGGDPQEVRSMIMEEEFRQLVDLGFKEGVLEEGESELIHRIFELGNKNVSEIMTPTDKMFALPISATLDRIVQEMRATQFNRVPIYSDNPTDIVGVLHARDVFRLYRGRQRGHMKDVEEIVRSVYFVSEKMSIENLLREFQKLKVHLAIVLNEERRVSGLVTMDDIFSLLFTRKLELRRGLTGVSTI